MTDGWYHGEKLLNGEQGWFPANYTKEVASEHVRARNLKQRHRLLALTRSVLQKRAKQNLAIYWGDRLQKCRNKSMSAFIVRTFMYILNVI